MSEKTKPVILISSFEPEEELNRFIEKIRTVTDAPIVISDDGSTGDLCDAVLREAERQGCIVLRQGAAKGIGKVLKSGFAHILQKYPEASGCITACQDGLYAAEDVAACEKELMAHPDSLILGCRKVRGFRNFLLKALCFVSGVHVSDPMTGLRGIPREFLKDLIEVPADGEGFPAELILASKDKYPVREIPVGTEEKTENAVSTCDRIKRRQAMYDVFIRRILSFSIAGATSTVLDLALFTLFARLLKDNSAHVFIATVLARILSCSYCFLLNRKLVFRANGSIWKSAARYAAVSVTEMLASGSFTTLFCSIFPAASETLLKFFVDSVISFAGFYVKGKFVFLNEKK